jgi:Electron transfer DM13
MIRFFRIAVPVFVLGFIAGNAFWYLFSPLWIDREISEVLPAEFDLTPVREGRFRDADLAHKGKGRAQVLVSPAGTTLVRLTEFSVTNGPDLEVWVVRNPDPKSSSDVKASEWISLGALKGNKGDQTYVVPRGEDIADYGSVVIWCEQFGVLFSSAPLSGV